ncbi:HNH endonuclease [Rhodovarius lipocyclicus]|uniref:HNH endonuclease n=1 Tax=Rhodovarius lipocyclicus TaxID=268410 RepID=UPI00135C7E74
MGKQVDPFYRSKAWFRLRHACLQRDQHRCVVPGCTNRATHADHIIPRSKGGADTLANTASICPGCHARKTALHDGGFGNKPSRQCPIGADGWPEKPSH